MPVFFEIAVKITLTSNDETVNVRSGNYELLIDWYKQRIMNVPAIEIQNVSCSAEDSQDHDTLVAFVSVIITDLHSDDVDDEQVQAKVEDVTNMLTTRVEGTIEIENTQYSVDCDFLDELDLHLA